MGEMGPGLRREGEDGRIVQNHERIWALARIGSPENSRICRILIIQRSDWEMPVFPLRLMLVTAIACAIAAPSRAAESQTTPGVSDTQIKIGQTPIGVWHRAQHHPDRLPCDQADCG